MNYQLYREWVKLREEGKVPPPTKSHKKESYSLSDYVDSIRDGSIT